MYDVNSQLIHISFAHFQSRPLAPKQMSENQNLEQKAQDKNRFADLDDLPEPGDIAGKTIDNSEVGLHNFRSFAASLS